MKTLQLNRAESAAYTNGERRFWLAMKHQPYDCGSDGMGGFVAVYLEPERDKWLNNGHWPLRCPYGKPGDRIELTMRDCPGAVQATITSVEVEQRGGRWGWVVEVGA